MRTATQSVPDRSETAADRDTDLQRLVLGTLRASDYPPVRELTCEVLDGVVILSGRVPSYYLKQMAQALILRLGRIAELRNQTEVRRAGR
jgi:hypothetical protein